MLRPVAFMSPLLLATPAMAQDWIVDHDASSVGFRTEAFGGSVEGGFSEWQAQITLDPDNLDRARISATVETASGDTGNGEINRSMLSTSGLAPETHAEARFVSEDIRVTQDGYAAHGTLTIKDTARDAVLPFTLDIAEGRAVADASLEIARTDFGVGRSNWGDTAARVTIMIHIEADAAAQ